MTPLAEEAASLWLREAEACRDTEDVEKAFEELLERALRDEEEAARV